MKRFDEWVLKAFLTSLPFLALYAAAAFWFELAERAQRNGLAKICYDLSGLWIGLTMSMALYLSVRLTLSAAFRETVLMKLTFVPERDEREVQLSAGAAKRTLLSSVALLLLLLCLSCFKIELSPLPEEQRIDGHTKQLSLQVEFRLLEEERQHDGPEPYVAYNGLPLSGSALVLGMLVWQVASYNYMMRRALRDGASATH